jgi:hypothetical protein
MKSLSPTDPKTDPSSHWRIRQLPVGLRIACTKVADGSIDFALPDFEEKGMVFTFINYKGDLHIQPGGRSSGQDVHRREPASPGLGLLSMAGRPLRFQSSAPIQFSALALFLPVDWILLFLKGNPHFSKIEQVLEEDGNILTCRLGRRQLSLFSETLVLDLEAPGNGLGIQNHTLSLLEYFLCNRHRSLLGANALSGIDNEDDLSLIREVESYISEYYCSDTFTVDSILKKTYTS